MNLSTASDNVSDAFDSPLLGHWALRSSSMYCWNALEKPAAEAIPSKATPLRIVPRTRRNPGDICFLSSRTDPATTLMASPKISQLPMALRRTSMEWSP